MHTTFDFRETWLHKINPSMKLLTMIVLFILVILIHNLNLMILFTMVTMILFVFFTGHPYKRILLFSIPFLIIFVSTATSMTLFGKGESTIIRWGLIHVTDESLFRGIHLGFRALTYAMLGLTFALTTRPVYLFYSLMQQLKLNPKYAYSFMAGIRLMPILIEEFQHIRSAQKVRGVRTGKGIKSLFYIFKITSIPLLSQCIRRAFRIAISMEAKRFDFAKKRTFYYKIGFSKYDVFFVGYYIALTSLALLLAQEFPFFPITDVRYLSE
jgi:energy-coupling factor transport system permease protein